MTILTHPVGSERLCGWVAVRVRTEPGRGVPEKPQGPARVFLFDGIACPHAPPGAALKAMRIRPSRTRECRAVLAPVWSSGRSGQAS